MDERMLDQARKMIEEAAAKAGKPVDTFAVESILKFTMDAASAIREAEKGIGRELTPEERKIASIVAFNMGTNTMKTLFDELEKMVE